LGFELSSEINNATGKENEQKQDEDSQKPSGTKGGKLFYMQKMRKPETAACCL
jgi:hypothetical protein